MGRISHELTVDEGQRRFPSTQWTDICEARSDGDRDRRHEALGRLMTTYWKPAYFFVRRRGYQAEDARDLTQGFFTAFLERDFLRYVDRARGKFRIFMRTALDHYLADEWDRQRALKRGGGVRHVSLDFAQADREFESASTGVEDPEVLFRRRWALALVKRALEVLRETCARGGKLAEYEALAPRLAESGSTDGSTYAQLAARLGVTEYDINNRLHRLRKLYRNAIWTELRNSTESDDQAEEELRELFAAFGT